MSVFVNGQRILLKVLVCGGREFGDYAMLKRALRSVEAVDGEIAEIIHGAARGADRLAGRFARENGIPCREFPADWNRYGTSAGPIRNREMMKQGQPDLVVAFPGGNGTEDMVRVAHDNQVRVWHPPQMNP